MQQSSIQGTAIPSFINTGVDGLDEILGGGLTPHRLYLIEGVPGSGKTTLALQYLLAGVKAGEPVLYITLSETKEELCAVARSHGWSLDNLPIHEVIPSEDKLQVDQQYTVFHPSEIELSETLKTILSEVERVKPTRIVFDSLSELRLLAGNPLRYRRQVLALKQYFAGRRCTVLVLDDRTTADHDLQVQSIAHGVILLEQLYPEFGAERRRLRVVKYRGVKFHGGFHDFLIRQGGLIIFPRLVAADHRHSFSRDTLSSGIPGLDILLGGGIHSGTSTLIVGVPGSGKSSLALQFVVAAARRGHRSAMFLFDESENTLQARAAGLGMNLQDHTELIKIQQVDPAELSPGEFIHLVRQQVDEGQARIIVIDSLNGYLNAMPEEHFLVIQLHELLTYLGQRGVATLMVSVQQGLIGTTMTGPVDASYLADSIILLRYFEANGEVRQAISVIKKRSGEHERTIREFKLEAGGIRVGHPLREFRGVLTGVPTYDGHASPLMQKTQSPAR